MIRTRTISAKEASLIAVSALDDLVVGLVRAKGMLLSPAFLDWVADEATPLVERRVDRSFNDPRFAATLRQGDLRIALAQWVHHWICPHIADRFKPLAEHLPLAESSPADLLPLRPLPAAVAGLPLPVSARPARVELRHPGLAVTAA